MTGPATLDISEARQHFNSLDERLREQPVIVIHRHNKEAFAVINIEYLETIMETIDVLSDPDAVTSLQKSIEDIQQGRVIDHDDVKDELW